MQVLLLHSFVYNSVEHAQHSINPDAKRANNCSRTSKNRNKLKMMIMLRMKKVNLSLHFEHTARAREIKIIGITLAHSSSPAYNCKWSYECNIRRTESGIGWSVQSGNVFTVFLMHWLYLVEDIKERAASDENVSGRRKGSAMVDDGESVNLSFSVSKFVHW